MFGIPNSSGTRCSLSQQVKPKSSGGQRGPYYARMSCELSVCFNAYCDVRAFTTCKSPDPATLPPSLQDPCATFEAIRVKFWFKKDGSVAYTPTWVVG